MELLLPRRPQIRTSSGRGGLIIFGLVAVVGAYAYMRDLNWMALKQTLRTKFPRVEWISTAGLAEYIDQREFDPFLLLDVRTPEEFAVSHISGAQRVDPGADPQVALAGVVKNTPIVTYCAVGYRSAEFAMKLRAAGFTRVKNLEGSIFQWANEHRPLVRGDNERVTQVHPYDREWAKLLAKDVRAPLP